MFKVLKPRFEYLLYVSLVVLTPMSSYKGNHDNHPPASIHTCDMGTLESLLSFLNC